MTFIKALAIAARDGLIVRSTGPHTYRYFVWAGRVCVYDRTHLRDRGIPPSFADFPPVDVLAGEWEAVSLSEINDEFSQNALQRHRKPREP